MGKVACGGALPAATGYTRLSQAPSPPGVFSVQFESLYGPQVSRPKPPAPARPLGETQLSAQMQAIARLLAIGATPLQIAQEMSLPIDQIRLVANEPLVRRRVLEFQASGDQGVLSIQERLQELAGEAVEAIGAAMRDPDDGGLRLRAASEVLDRTGHAKQAAVTHRHSHAHGHVYLTQKRLASIRKRALEGEIIEAHAEETYEDAYSD